MEIDKDDTEKGSSSFLDFQLPTGFVENDLIFKDCVVREMTGEEEDLLLSSKTKSFQKTQSILEKCIVKIGSYDQNHPNWSSIVKGLVHTDRLFCLVRIRIASLGNILRFDVVCPECEKKSSQQADLFDFNVKGITDPHNRTWRGNLPKSGISFIGKVQTGFDDEKPVNPDDDGLSSMMSSRLVELDGKTPTPAQLKSLGMQDRQFLRKQMKDHEGEMDDQLDIACPHCCHEFSTTIDLTSSNFFFPSVI